MIRYTVVPQGWFTSSNLNACKTGIQIESNKLVTNITKNM